MAHPVVPPLTVAKAVVVFVQGSHAPGPAEGHPNLDRLARLGCCGRLLPRHLGRRDDLAELLQVAGVYAALYGGADASKGPRLADDHGRPLHAGDLYRRYGDLKVGFLSNDTEVISLAERLQLPASVLLPSSGDVTVTYQHLTSALERVDIVLVHLKDQPTLSAISFADSLVERLQEKEKGTLLVFVGNGKRPVDGDDTDKEKRTSTDFYYPQQSSTVIDGKPGAVLQESGALLAAYYHEGTTRRDEVQRFTEALIKDKGANGAIAAEQFVSELAFKLGKTPKYGA